MKFLRRKANQNTSIEILTKIDANNESKYEDPSVTYDPFFKDSNYFNTFKCGNNLLNRIDVKYERACIETPRDKYYTKMLETLVDYNDRNNAQLSNEKLQQAMSKFIA